MINTKDNLEIMEFVNENNGMSIRTILNKDGSVSMNAEDTAIGFGWNREKSGKTMLCGTGLTTFVKVLVFHTSVERMILYLRLYLFTWDESVQ